MDKKLIFYSELYRDSSIDQNAKQKIRDLVEDIQTYQRHLNQYLEVPIVEIDFRDVKDIAYTVGTFKDKRSKLVQELFSPINPLDEKGRSVSNFYEKLKKENVLLPGFFIDEVFENSKILLRYTLEESEINSQIIPSIKSISDHFIDYKKRAVILDKYNKYHVFLNNFYKEKISIFNEQYTISELKSLPSMDWKDNLLSEKRVEELRGYFERQFFINDILANTLSEIHFNFCRIISHKLNN